MENLMELERVLSDIEFLSDTFSAIHIANQNRMISLPEDALAIPTEALKKYILRAKEINTELLMQKVQ